MNIQHQNGIVSTINFTPYLETVEYQNLRNSLFDEASKMSNFVPKNHMDVFDESIFIFENYSQALEFLTNIFRVAVKLGEYSNINFNLRSSLCHGDFFIHQDQIYGDAINLATRLACSSRENELLVCGIDRHIIEEYIDGQNDVAYFIRNQDKNCISICLLDEDTTQARGKNTVFHIECNNKTRAFVSSRNQKIHIGRSDDSDIFIDSDQISRNHATITLNYENIFIEDHSSNGTYLYYDNREIFLTNDSMKISSDGHISCGRQNQPKKSSTNIISYLFCEEAQSAA